MYYQYKNINHVLPQTLNLGEVVTALSHALDLSQGQPTGHCVRACWIGYNVGRALELDAETLSDLFYTILLKDLGCSSNAARICELYVTDDITFKRDVKTVDDSLSSALRFLLSNTGMEAGFAERMRALVNTVSKSDKIANELIQTRCHRGADIAGKMRFSENVQAGILSLDEHYNGKGQPLGLAGNDIPVNANLALIGQVADVFFQDKGREAAIEEIKSRSGSWFAPEIVDAFLQVTDDASFWNMLNDEALDKAVFALHSQLDCVAIDEDFLDDIASAFSDVVDAKSSFTADHSNRVTYYTDVIAEELGLDDAHRRWLRRAALLHDVGKLGVSNAILDKQGKPTEEEWEKIRAHPFNSERILEKVSAFADIAPIAGAHHERLDGKGYPYGLSDEEICGEVRILTVADVFDALTAARPYRDAMPIAKAFSILDDGIGSAFDARCVTALKRGMARLNAEVA